MVWGLAYHYIYNGFNVLCWRNCDEQIGKQRNDLSCTNLVVSFCGWSVVQRLWDGFITLEVEFKRESVDGEDRWVSSCKFFNRNFGDVNVKGIPMVVYAWRYLFMRFGAFTCWVIAGIFNTSRWVSVIFQPGIKMLIVKVFGGTGFFKTFDG